MANLSVWLMAEGRLGPWFSHSVRAPNHPRVAGPDMRRGDPQILGIPTVAYILVFFHCTYGNLWDDIREDLTDRD